MTYTRVPAAALLFLLALILSTGFAGVAHAQTADHAIIDGTGPGWASLTIDDFSVINGHTDTWWSSNDMIRTTGNPIGVMCTRKSFTNVEMVVDWRHNEPGGNSGTFLWVPGHALEDLPTGELPDYGIEIQMLDPAFREQYQEETGEKGDFFTTHGDVWGVGKSELDPFPPVSPSGVRSFPRKKLTRDAGNWNHYYVRAINGEVRLWVNGEEVSGGNNAQPRSGRLCLEAEGAAIDFRNLRIRELP